MLHLLIGIVALVWTLVGLWVLRRMWAISAAERRERKLERRELERSQPPKQPGVFSLEDRTDRLVFTFGAIGGLVTILFWTFGR